jgi:hypothetical protein
MGVCLAAWSWSIHPLWAVGIAVVAFIALLPIARRPLVDGLLGDAEGQIRVRHNGVFRPAALQEAWVHPLLIVLRFDGVGTVLLWPDSADADALRHLRVLLRKRNDQTGANQATSKLS